jgi:hypothetical protein
MRNRITLASLALLLALPACSVVTAADIAGVYPMAITSDIAGVGPSAVVDVRASSPTAISFDPDIGCEVACELTTTNASRATGTVDTACVSEDGATWVLSGSCTWSAPGTLSFTLSGTVTTGPASDPVTYSALVQGSGELTP